MSGLVALLFEVCYRPGHVALLVIAKSVILARRLAVTPKVEQQHIVAVFRQDCSERKVRAAILSFTV